MNRSILQIAALLLALTLNSSASDLTGRVQDVETGNLVMGANVRIVENGKTVESDKHGQFIIKQLADSTYHLIVTHVAYDRSDTIAVAVNGNQSIDIKLKPMPWVLNDVVVTGTRSPHLLKDVPVQTEVVGQRDFQRVGAKSVDEALSASVGVGISTDFAGEAATIRGVEGSQVLVMVDGQRAVGRINGNLDLSQYSLANVEKIEVVKGTGSTLYGSDAMGGVINIITKKPESDVRKANLYADLGTYRTMTPTMQLNIGSTRTAVDFGGKFLHTDGFDLDKSTLHTNGGDKISRWNFDTKVTHSLSQQWKLTADARYMHERRNWFESEPVPGLPDFNYGDKETNNRYDGSATLDFVSGEKYSMKLRAYGTLYKHDFEKWYLNSNLQPQNWIDTSRTTDDFWEVAYSSNYMIGQNHVITYGADYNQQGLDSKELYANAKSDRSGDAYMSYEYSPVKGVTILPGVRYENHSSWGQKVNPSFNLMVQPSEGLKLRGFVGQGFRAPSIKEQYFVFDHSAAGYIVYGGEVPLPDSIKTELGGYVLKPLKEENSVNSSVSAEISYGTIGLHRITYFYNHLENLINFHLVGFPGEYWRGMYIYQNVERAITQGIEWESRVRVSKSLDFSFSYDYLYSRDLGSHEKLANRPDHTLKFFLSGHLDKPGVGATFWGVYQSYKVFVARNNTGGNEGTETQYAPHRTVLNLNLYKKLGTGMETFIRFENILNQTDITYGYWPGFQVFAGFKFDFDLHSITKR
ncbi:MAG: TonB-dependent receptor [Candidatus Zixiibacteriota bacterium]